MFSRRWWRDALERAVRTGAAAALAGLGADQAAALDLPKARTVLLLIPGGALVSLLLSLAASGTGDAESAAFAKSA